MTRLDEWSPPFGWLPGHDWPCVAAIDAMANEFLDDLLGPCEAK